MEANGLPVIAQIILSLVIAAPVLLVFVVAFFELADGRRRRAQKRAQVKARKLAQQIYEEQLVENWRRATGTPRFDDYNPKTKPIIVSDNWKWKD